MQRLFGRRPTSASPSMSDADVLAELVEQKRMLELRVEHLQRKVETETEAALKAKQAGQKAAALSCLKRMKMINAELDSLSEQRLKMDTQEHMLQSLKFTEATVATERRATEAIQAKVRAIGGADGVENARAKTEETLEDAYELLGLAAQPLANPALDGATDEELLAELEAEEARAMDAMLLQVDAGSSSGASADVLAMPTAPSAPRAACSSQEERELAELETLAASMNLAVERPMPMLGRARQLMPPLVIDKPIPMLGMAPPLVSAM